MGSSWPCTEAEPGPTVPAAPAGPLVGRRRAEATRGGDEEPGGCQARHPLGGPEGDRRPARSPPLDGSERLALPGLQVVRVRAAGPEPGPVPALRDPRRGAGLAGLARAARSAQMGNQHPGQAQVGAREGGAAGRAGGGLRRRGRGPGRGTRARGCGWISPTPPCGSAWCWPWPSTSASRPTPRTCAHRSRQAVRGVLYAGLVALALWWTAAGEPLNGFDAALWLLCFFAVEGNMPEARERGACPARVTGRGRGLACEAGVRGTEFRPCSGAATRSAAARPAVGSRPPSTHLHCGSVGQRP